MKLALCGDSLRRSDDTRAKGVHELWNRVKKEWSTFTAEDCRRYIDSMPDRCRAVIAAKGGHTRY